MRRLIGSLIALVMALSFGLAAQAEEGKAEKAGKKVDDAADKTEVKAKSAVHATKRYAKKVKRKTGEALEETGEKIK